MSELTDPATASSRPAASRAGTPAAETPGTPRLLATLRAALRVRHYSPRTEEAYVAWVRRFVRFHKLRHPRELGPCAVAAFLSDLATRARVSASTQNQALAALLFLYREVLREPPPALEAVVRAKRPHRLPVVLTRDEARAVLAELTGAPRLVALLLYGSGLRLLEALRLRVKDLDLARGELTVRGGKGDKDRRTVLPAAAAVPLREHLTRVRALHTRDLARGAGRVVLPEALEREAAASGAGVGLAVGSPRPRTTATVRRGSAGGTTSTSRPSSGRSGRRC